MKFQVPMPVRVVLAFLGPALAAGAGEESWSTISSGQLVSMIIAGIMGAGALLAPSGKAAPTDKAVASVQDVVAKTAEAHEQLTQQAVTSVERLKDAVGDLLGGVFSGIQLPLSGVQLPPVQLSKIPADAVWQRPLGPLAQQAITAATDTTKRP